MAIDPPSAARPEEMEPILGLLTAQLDEHAIPLARERLAQAVHRGLADDGQALILVARAGTRPIGVAYLSFQWTLDRGGRAMWVEELYVVPALRGRGTGTALLRAALEVARARGCPTVELEVEGSHARAENLYARAGFRRLDRVHLALSLG